MMNSEEQDALWELLGKAKEPAVSPFFSRNVLRELRIVAVTSLAGASYVRGRAHASESAVQKLVKNKDYETIRHLDELLAYEENTIWLENSSE
jgi:hypothetical protein